MGRIDLLLNDVMRRCRWCMNGLWRIYGSKGIILNGWRLMCIRVLLHCLIIVKLCVSSLILLVMHLSSHGYVMLGYAMIII
jgi:hypothetical protein